MRRLTAALLLLIAAPAGAYEIDDRIVPQPKLTYTVLVKDWRRPMARAVKALNRARVGVRLVAGDQGSIQVGRLESGCGQFGTLGTTQNLVGGFAAIYLPHGCKGTRATIIAAHELGHALGLLHDDDGCALMNSSGTGPLSIPTGCLGGSYPWAKQPYRSDDIKGLKRLYRNTPPKVTLKLTGPSTVRAGTSVTFKLTAKDREKNLSMLKLDYGDGTDVELFPGDPLPTSHLYTQPGNYTIRFAVRDLYLKRDVATARVKVTATAGSPRSQ